MFGGHKDLVQFFIEKGVENWREGLEAAVAGEHRRLIDFFLTKKIYHFDNVLEIAARRGNWELVNLFIEKGSKNWNRALRGAASGGHLDMIEFFLEKGAELSWGFRGAVRAARRDIMDLFIQKGFKDIYIALDEAMQSQQVDIVKFILNDERVGGYVALLRALRLGNGEIADLILRRDYSMLDYQNVWPDAFKAAVQGGHLGFVKYFAEEHKIEKWENGLSGAARGGYPDLIRYFIDKGAKDWDRALVAAHEGGEDWLIPYFLSRGAKDWNKMMAIAVDHDKLFNYAISKGANDWNKGLSYAAKKGNMRRIEYFLERGANPLFGLQGASKTNNVELVDFFTALMTRTTQ